MLRNPRVLSRSRCGRGVRLHPEILEGRMLLSGSSFTLDASGSAPKQVVSLEVPSAYVSQSATSIDLTITRSMGSKQRPINNPLTLSVNAVSLSPASEPGGKPVVSSQIAPVNQTVTFAGGQMSQTVELPINVQAPLPTLVPVQITVAPNSGPHTKSAVLTVDLASGQQYVPPSITNVSIVRQGSVGKGIALTFSEPMSPAIVENIHNYVMKSVPLNKVTFLTAPSSSQFFQPVSYSTSSPQVVPLKAARYDPTTDTVLLIPKSPLTVAKSFIVASPSSLGSRHPGPKAAQPLSDANGNVLNPLHFPEGQFSITISPKSS